MTSNGTMHASRIHEFGDENVLQYETAPIPTPSNGDVLIKIAAAGVNPVDWKTRQGGGIACLLKDVPFPHILGWDVSGEIIHAPDESELSQGDLVYGMVNFPQIGGAYAEYVTAPADHVALKPKNVDHTTAAALPLVGLTAWQALFDAGNLQAGQRVLIQAAAGGVGHIAVQLAKWAGAYVIGTASPTNHDYLRQLGADEVISYRDTDLSKAVSDIDLVLDSLNKQTQLEGYQVLKRGGTLVSITEQPDSDVAAEYGVNATHVLVKPNADQLKQMADLVDTGQLKVTISQVLPLADAAEAHRLSATKHTRGKIVLSVNSDS